MFKVENILLPDKNNWPVNYLINVQFLLCYVLSSLVLRDKVHNCLWTDRDRLVFKNELACCVNVFLFYILFRFLIIFSKIVNYEILKVWSSENSEYDNFRLYIFVLSLDPTQWFVLGAPDETLNRIGDRILVPLYGRLEVPY